MKEYKSVTPCICLNLLKIKQFNLRCTVNIAGLQ